jgi:hypothetical protein
LAHGREKKTGSQRKEGHISGYPATGAKQLSSAAEECQGHSRHAQIDGPLQASDTHMPGMHILRCDTQA